MLALLVSCLLLQSAPSSTGASVSFTMRAAPLEKAVAEIARQSGANLAVDAPIAKELVILRLKDVPLADVKKRLAETVDAVWTTQGANEVLTRSEEIVQRRKEEAFAERVAIWQGIIDAFKFDEQWDRRFADTIGVYARGAGQDPSPSQQEAYYQRQSSFLAQSPQGRLLSRALHRIGAERLAQVGDGQTVVFSTKPTRMQAPLEDPQNSLYDAYVTEGRSWAQVLQQYPEGARGQLGSTAPFNGDLPAPGGTVLVGVTSGRENVVLDARVYAGDGSEVSRMAFPNYFLVNEQPKPLPGFSKPVVDSAETAAIRRLYHPAPGDQPNAVPSLALEVLANPEQHELMAGGPSDIALQAAESKNLNLVAWLPDAAHVLSMKHSSSQKPTLGSELTALQPLAKVNVDEKAGWLTMSRRACRDLDGFAIPRQAIAALIKAYRSSGATTLSALADYSTAGVNNDALDYGLNLADRLIGRPRGYLTPESWTVLRLYAALSSRQRNAASHGGLTLSVGEMTKAQRQSIADLVSAQRFEALSDDGSPAANPWGSIRSEATVAMPNGLPANGKATFQLQTTPQVYGLGDDTLAQPSPVMPVQVARGVFQQERGQTLADNTVARQNRFAMGNRQSLSIVLEMPPAGRLAMLASVQQIPSNARWVGLAQLPKAVREQIEAELKALREGRSIFSPAAATPPPNTNSGQP